MSQVFELGFVVDESARFVHVVVDGTSLAEINFIGHKVEVSPWLSAPAAAQEQEIQIKNLKKDVTLISTDDVKIEVEWESRRIKLPSNCEALLSTRWAQGNGLSIHLRKSMNMEDRLMQDLREGGGLI
jgi:hypothetical protein